MSVDQLERLLSAYRSYDVEGPRQLRALIARQSQSLVSVRALRSASDATPRGSRQDPSVDRDIDQAGAVIDPGEIETAS
jgi:hypothetical protein